MQYVIKERDEGSLTVFLEGRLNFSSDQVFQRLMDDLLSHRKSSIVIDISQLTHIDSVGLGLLYIAREDLEAVGSTICLAHPRDNVFRMLQLTEACRSFEIRAGACNI